MRWLALPPVALVFAVAILEVGLRFHENPHRFLTPECIELGTGFHHRYKKNCRTTTIYYGRKVEFAYNELGVRDRPLKALDLHRPRVLVLGDSNAEGWGVDAESTIPSRLEKLFDNKIQFINASIRFAGPILQALRFRELFTTYRPVAVLWLLTEKDYGYDRFTNYLIRVRDQDGFPTEFSLEDVSPAAQLLKRAGAALPGKSYFLEFLTQSIAAKNMDRIRRLGAGIPFDPCQGVALFTKQAARLEVPVLPILMPIGPNYTFEDEIGSFPPIWDCIKRSSAVPPLDTRVPRIESPDLMLPHDSHFNPKGTLEFAEFVGPRIEEFLRKSPTQ